MLTEILVAILILGLIGFLWLFLNFRRWKGDLLRKIEAGGKIAETPRGPVEYSFIGSGPTILISHGGPGGYDQGEFLMKFFAQQGFSVLSVSRPGYLGTPIESGATFEEQADTMVSLLDSLNIHSVAVIGVSAGGPAALQLAMRHHERLWSLILMGAVSQEYIVEEISLLGRIFMSGTIADMGLWIFDFITRHWPLYALTKLMEVESTLNKEEIKKFIEEIKKSPAQVEWFKEFLQTTIPMSVRKLGLDNDLKQLKTVADYPLEKIRVPTLIVHGTADKDVPFTHAEFANSKISNSSLLSLEGVGHILWLGNHQDELKMKILKFLQSNSHQIE
ncbi:MAG: alpha/beta hydrolase [Candidatus Helarchaeota archaeon]|nr:alpha/beta hydrolase [Candidatus Helarchaeota archaeon]